MQVLKRQLELQRAKKALEAAQQEHDQLLGVAKLVNYLIVFNTDHSGCCISPIPLLSMACCMKCTAACSQDQRQCPVLPSAA